MTSRQINPHILRYIEMVERGEIRACNDQKELVQHVRHCFDTENIYTDDEQLEKYIGLAKYLPFERLFEWEEFCLALHLCTFWKDTGRPRWPDLFLFIARGAGKDGYIAMEALCLISPYSKLQQYDVDICANAEEQAVRPVADVIDGLEDQKHRTKMKRHFYWTKELVKGLLYRGTIRGRTNNPKSKDGMRSGMVVFNEIHQYENYNNLKVFETSLGKKKHPRRLYATTNGDVREGPLDELLARSEDILKGKIDDGGFLPFICRLNEKKEVDDKDNWEMANPSLPYLPDLMHETEKEYNEWKLNPIAHGDFMTKRMNIPQSAMETAVTCWDNIIATYIINKQLRIMPELMGRNCVAGIDYAMITDWASVDLHFRDGNMRYDINHSWLCLQSRDLHRLKVPWKEWSDAGRLTLIDDVEISPDILAAYVQQMGEKYNILKLALDQYRYALLASSFKKIGFDATDYKNMKLVRPMDIMKIAPVIDSCFVNQYYIWGDAPVLRWATNNAKRVPAGKKLKAVSGGAEADYGNYVYGKIEPKSRKTDPFMSLAAAMTIEDELGDGQSGAYDDLPVIIG
jgi:phage terminase large subunit-like protein